jgi:hypothetical protein
LVDRYSLFRLPDDAGDGEVVHLIVHDDAGGGGHELAAPDQVDARRYCACVELLVHFLAASGDSIVRWLFVHTGEYDESIFFKLSYLGIG